MKARENNGYAISVINPSSYLALEITEAGYVEMQEEQIFWIKLVNDTNYDVAATVSMNDDPMGSFIIEARSQTVLKNPDPKYATGQFKSVRQGSANWDAAGMDQVDKDSRGVISVSFQPGAVRHKSNVVLDSFSDFTKGATKGGNLYESYGVEDPRTFTSYSAQPSSKTHEDMGIGLRGENVQDFQTVEFDAAKTPPTVIEVKLIAPKQPTQPTIKPTRQTLRPRSLS